MSENDANQRRVGFMTAMGLLVRRSDAEQLERLLSILSSFGDDLYKEVESQENLDNAPDINPCPAGFRWDSGIGTCVPIVHEPNTK